MRDMMISLFNDFAGVIIFFHVISAVVWVGGMIAIRFSVHGSISHIEQPEVKLEIALKYLKSFFAIVTPMIGLLLVTAVLMTIGLGFKGTDLSPIVHTKETIWLIMTVVFIMIRLKRNKAQMYFDSKDFKNAKKTLAILSIYLIPLNIILGTIAIYLGITLRGF